MKFSNRSLKFLFLVALFPGFSGLFSQHINSGMAPIIPTRGYIIMNNGDTLDGKIKYKKFTENNISQIQFTDPSGEKVIYDAGDLKGIGIEVFNIYDDAELPFMGESFWDIYEVLPSIKKGVPVFMNRFEKGVINVFQNRSSNNRTSQTVKTKSRIDGIYFSYSGTEGLEIGPTFKTSVEVIESRARFSSYYVQKNGGALIKVNRNNYGELWNDLLGDCPKIIEEVRKEPDLKDFKNFLIIIKVYNRLCEEPRTTVHLPK